MTPLQRYLYEFVDAVLHAAVVHVMSACAVLGLSLIAAWLVELPVTFKELVAFSMVAALFVPVPRGSP